MSNMINLDQFLQLKTAEREQYVLEKTKLEDFWVLGYVQNPSEDKPFFFINELINPYTTKDLNTFLFTDKNMTSTVFCSVPTDVKHFEDGTFVAVKVRLNSDAKKLADRKLFTTSYKDVHEIESAETIQTLIRKIGLELPILALSKPKYQVHTEDDFVAITELIQTYGEQERAAITEHEEAERAKISAQLAQMASEKEALVRVTEQLQATKQSVEEEKKAIQQKVFALEQLGFTIDASVKAPPQNPLPILPLPEKGSELVKGIQQQLAARGYQYEERFVRQLLMSLMTGQMLVLMGPSGTGKTTIVRQLADVLSAHCEIIPVQPSWTDKQDLLGFYNPIRKLFVPSAFLDCLVKAKENPEKLFFICLDEMNLAQIEYYLADLLSIREVPNEKLRLYSDFEYEQNISEIRWAVQHLLKMTSLEEAMATTQIDSMQHFELIARYQNMKRYTAQLAIPDNVRIIGTMNVDGSVQTISPKIVDRAFIIPVMKQQEKVKGDVEIGRYTVNFAATMEAPMISPTLRSALNKMYGELETLSITYNDRVEKHVKQYYRASSTFDVSTKQLLDDLALMKLYPRIHQMRSEIEVVQFVEKMNEQLDYDSAAAKKLAHMQQRMQETGLFSYWS